MKDQFQRTIDYARISITDRCNLYCTYCRPDHEEMYSSFHVPEKLSQKNMQD